MKNTKQLIAILLVCAILGGLGICASADQKQRADVVYPTVEAPEASQENGVITAAEWAAVLPEVAASYEANADNSYNIDYLEEDPYLKEIYEGFGFAKDYKSARGHSYSLADGAGTARPHPLANCLTCKTADFTALVNAMGTEAYSLAYEDVLSTSHEDVGCYTCHENSAGEGGKIVITHDYTAELLDGTIGSVDMATLACAQCHIEYYFDGNDNKATSVPYTCLEDMLPQSMLEFYNSIDFADYTQESTGARLLKVQHPEFETYLAPGGQHAAFGLTCADCHMATATAEDGTAYVSHKLESPLENEALLASCVQCHGTTDMAEKVHTLQAGITAREKEIGNKLAELKLALADANASGEYTEDELNAIRDLYRSAVWFFDFDYVENAEGAHNSKLANECLDEAEAYIAQALELFKA